MNPLRSVFRFLLRNHEKVLFWTILCVLTPCFFIFEMVVVRPQIAQLHNIGPIVHTLHVLFSGYCFLNVVGNMVLSVATNTALNRSYDNGHYCPVCSILRPTDSWHCNRCNACILRRDHHCVYFGKCIGLHNQRYYIMYLCYMMISMVYSSYYNYCFVAAKFDELGMVISIFRIMNPLFRFMVSEESMGMKDVYMLFLIINVGLLIWSASLFSIHFKNALKGVTTHGSKYCCTDMKNWKVNLESVFGRRWLLAMLFFFVDSPVPENVKMK